jgi:3',5'-cyclic AMP phosphodiesterase CpdA
MRTLIHMSDLHFGRIDPTLLDPLRDAVAQIAPALTVISGDLTQRARSSQFKDARAFIDSLFGEKLIVPGNHDVPLWNVVARMATPLRKYKKYITEDLGPMFVDDEIAVLGINTARSMVIKNGRINEEQIDAVRNSFCTMTDNVTKIVVTHHPFDLPDGHDDDDLVGRAEEAMQTFAQCGADVLLAGHFHTSHAETTAARYRIIGHAALVIQAGTATSTRERGEENSFNVLRIEHPRIGLERWSWDKVTSQFRQATRDDFESREGEWVRTPAEGLVTR